MRRLLTINEPVLRTPQSRSTWHPLDASVACRAGLAGSIGSAASCARRDGSGRAASCSATARSGGSGGKRSAPTSKSAVTAIAGWTPCQASGACRPAQSATTAPRCLRGRAASGERQVRWWVGGWHPCSERPRAAAASITQRSNIKIPILVSHFRSRPA